METKVYLSELLYLFSKNTEVTIFQYDPSDDIILFTGTALQCQNWLGGKYNSQQGVEAETYYLYLDPEFSGKLYLSGNVVDITVDGSDEYGDY